MRVWPQDKQGYIQRCPRLWCRGQLHIEITEYGPPVKKCILCSREFDLTKKELRDYLKC